MEIFQSLFTQVSTEILAFAPRLVYAIIILVIGFFVIKILKRLFYKVLEKRKIESTIKSFLTSFFTFTLNTLLIISVISMLGVQMTSFIAILGAAGIAVGLALQGSLSNFAGGILILVFKPFKVGDLVEVENHLGTVKKIDILYTRLNTFDNRLIIMPNGTMANATVDNRTAEKLRRVDIFFTVAFDTNYEKLEKLLVPTLKKHKLVVKDPEPDIKLDQFAESGMKIFVRSWTKSEDFWPVYWDQMKAVKTALDKEGIKITVPKRDITVSNPKPI